MKLLAAGVAVVATVVATAQVKPTQKAQVVLGQGGLQCAVWTRATSRQAADLDQVSWSLGYISAMASTDPSLRSVTPSFVRGWIGGYCGQNPNSTIADVTQVLVDSLKTGTAQ